jgi:hypothetical protein
VAVNVVNGVEIRGRKASGPPTALGLTEEAALAKAAESQLEDTRKAAENWRTGLAALITLVATIFFIKGRESVLDIDVGWRWLLAGAIGAGFLFAVWGAWLAMRAAYGTPAATDYGTIMQEGGWASYRAGLAASAADNLRDARRLTIAALVCLVAAVLLTWFAPKPASSPPALVLATVGTDKVCGELTGVGAGDLQIKDEAPIPFDQLAALSLVQECPT